MQKIFTIIVFIVLAGCGSDPQYQDVMLNKTVKVFSEDYHGESENYTFKWTPLPGPHNETIIFDLKNDIFIFTPKIIGNYQIKLDIEDISEEIIAKEIFYFRAIPETTEVAIAEYKQITPTTSPATIKKKYKKQLPKKSPPRITPKNKIQKSQKKTKQPNTSKITNVKYAIQISAWHSLEEARKHQLDLIEEGFDAYTQRYYLQEKDEVWYRVRVGNFLTSVEAMEIKKQIETLTGITAWLDIVLSN